MTSAFCLFVFETFVSRLLALFGTIMTSESGNPTPPGDKWERKLLVFGIFYSFLTSGRPLSSSTADYETGNCLSPAHRFRAFPLPVFYSLSTALMKVSYACFTNMQSALPTVYMPHSY